MRIVFVAWQGSEHTRRWAGFFATRGHDVHVVTCGDGNLTDRGTPAYAVHDLGLPRGGKLGYLLKVRRARGLVRSLLPDVVHAHHATSYGLLAACANVHPFVVTCHGSDVLVSGQRFPMRQLVRGVLDRADLVTAPAEHIREGIRALPSSTPVEVFQYGVDVERLGEVASAVRSTHVAPPDGVVRIVTARPLEPLYHTDDVIRAVATLREQGVTCRYDLAGKGSELAALRRLAADVDVDDCVTFHGHLPEPAVEELVAAADVYVSVADSDGVSIALLEALALGPTPVLSDIRANSIWVRDGVNGKLVDISPAAIADGIQQALELDREDVARRNLELVRARGDRATNLAACETLLLDLIVGRTSRTDEKG